MRHQFPYFCRMQIIDTHTHLYVEAFDLDRAEMMERATAAGVTHFFVPAIDSTYTERMYALEKSYPEVVHLMAGVHPCHVKQDVEEELNKVAAQLKQRSFCAIGEIGIDLYWDQTYLKQQQEAFSKQIEWAKQYHLPIVIHCREAFDEVFEILETHRSETLFGIFHCFSGNLTQAQQAISLGLKLGIGGVATFKNGKIDQFLNQIDLKHIVLETDSPYLAPVPHRGKRNESAYTTLVAQKVAEIYQLPIEENAKITTENSKHVFGI